MSRGALLLGATGLVGRAVLEALLADPHWDRITVLSRRPTGIKADSCLTEIVAPLEDISRHTDAFAVDDVFCCLGTTLRKAGSREAFRHVDHDLCVRAARTAAAAGAGNFLMVSAINARAGSPVFYSRVKGQTEQDVQHSGVAHVHFFQPSFLLGDRPEGRPAEQLGIRAMGLIRPLLHRTGSKLTPVPASLLARAMLAAALQHGMPAVTRYRYADFLRLAGQA